MGLAALLFVVGGLLWVLGRSGGGLLPGDIVIRRGNFTLMLPIVTMLVLSVVVTIVLNIFFRR